MTGDSDWEGVSCSVTQFTKLAVLPCNATGRAAAAVDLCEGRAEKLWVR